MDFLIWTINLKSFEIAKESGEKREEAEMNYKLEKFWNKLLLIVFSFSASMNYKLEKFWNKRIL